MSLPVIVRPEACAELREAREWYEVQRPGLGEKFEAAVRACKAEI